MKVAKIEDYLDDDSLNDLLKEHKDSYNIYRRVLLINMVKNGDTIKNSAKRTLSNIYGLQLIKTSLF